VCTILGHDKVLFYASICYTALVFFIVYHFVVVHLWGIFTVRRYASAVYAVVMCLLQKSLRLAALRQECDMAMSIILLIKHPELIGC